MGFTALAKIASFCGSRISAMRAGNEGSLKSSHGFTLCCDGNQQRMSRPAGTGRATAGTHHGACTCWGAVGWAAALFPQACERPKQGGIALRLGGLELP